MSDTIKFFISPIRFFGVGHFFSASNVSRFYPVGYLSLWTSHLGCSVLCLSIWISSRFQILLSLPAIGLHGWIKSFSYYLRLFSNEPYRQFFPMFSSCRPSCRPTALKNPATLVFISPFVSNTNGATVRLYLIFSSEPRRSYVKFCI